MECIHCEAEFDPNSPAKRRAGGRINECPDCAQETSVRYLAGSSNGGKVAGIEVLKFESQEDRARYARWRAVASGMHKGKSCPLGDVTPCPVTRVQAVTSFGGNDNHKGRQ